MSIRTKVYSPLLSASLHNCPYPTAEWIASYHVGHLEYCSQMKELRADEGLNQFLCNTYGYRSPDQPLAKQGSVLAPDEPAMLCSSGFMVVTAQNAENLWSVPVKMRNEQGNLIMLFTWLHSKSWRYYMQESDLPESFSTTNH